MTKSEQTRQYIIEKSAPVFNIKGVAGTAMSDIMEATGLAKGSLYVHFKDKDDLSCHVAQYNLRKLVERVAHALSGPESVKKRFSAFLNLFTESSSPVPGGCPMLNFGMEADDTHPPIRKKVQKTLAVMKKLLTDLFQEGIRRGEFTRALDAHEFAIKTIAMVEGGILMARVSGKQDSMTLISSMLRKELEGYGT